MNKQFRMVVIGFCLGIGMLIWVGFTVVSQNFNGTQFIVTGTTISMAHLSASLVDSGKLKLFNDLNFNGFGGTNIAHLDGTNGAVQQFGGNPPGTMWSLSNSLVSAGATVAIDTSGTLITPGSLYSASITAYASSTGQTNNTGLTPSSPWPMPYALTRVGGGVLNIMPGTNTGAYWDVTATNSGLVIQPYGYPQTKWNSIFVCTNLAASSIFVEPNVSNVLVRGMNIYGNTNQDAIKGVGAINLTVQDCWLHDIGGNGVLATETSGFLIERCAINNAGLNNALANHLHGLYVSGTNGTIRNCVFYDNTNGWGIQIYGNTSPSNNVGWQVYNNLIYTNSRGAYCATQNGFTNYFWNNTIANNINQAFEADSSGTGTTCFTNGVAIRGSGAAIEGLGGVLIEDYNIVGLATNSPGTHDIVSTAPGFVNSAAGLYWPTPAYVGIGKAYNGATLPVDFFGNGQITNSEIGFVSYFPNWKSFDKRKLYQSTWPDYWLVRSDSGTASAQTPWAQPIDGNKQPLTNVLSITVGNDPMNGQVVIAKDGVSVLSTNAGIFYRSNNVAVGGLAEWMNGWDPSTNGNHIFYVPILLPTNGINIGGMAFPGAGNLLATNVVDVSNDVRVATISIVPLLSTRSTDATTTSTTMATTGLSVTLLAGKSYQFQAELFLSDSTSVDGAKIDFAGGTATATTFRAQVTAFDTALNLSSQPTALNTVASASTFTGAGAFEVHGYIKVNAGGTFIPEFAQAAHTTGTLTLAQGSFIRFIQTP